MFYYIYKITNINNGCFYIGSHKTYDLNDGYFGSGIYLKRAIKKYGKESFKKEIIKECRSLEEMLLAETEELQKIKNNDVYNLKFYSMGGNTREKYSKDEKTKYIQNLVLNPNSPIGKQGKFNHMFGKKHSNRYKKTRSEQQTQYYIDLKKNNPEAYNNWYNGVMKSAVKNCIKNAEKNCKKIVGFNKITGEKLVFKGVTYCARELKMTPYRLYSIIDGSYKHSTYTLSFQ